MSGIDFSIGSGVESGTRDYEYGEAAVLEIRKEEKEPSFEESEQVLTRSLAERIHQSEEGIYQIAVIDNVIRVKTLSKPIVAQKIRFWESRKISDWNHMIGGIAVFVSAAAYGILTGSRLGGCGALLGGAYAFYEGSQMAQAKGEIEKWKRDPLKEIADQRLTAFKQGLIYIYKEDRMRSYPQEFQKILSRNELHGLYRQYFHSLRDRLASAHDDKTKLLLLSEVACYSPLASHIYRYALLPQEKVDQMEEGFTRYIHFLRDYNSVDARIEREMERINESHKIPIEMIEKEKENILNPILQNYEAIKLELLNEKTAKLEGPPPTGVEIEDFHRNVKEEFAEREKLAETQFQHKKTKALRESNERLEKLQKSKAETLKKIQNDRNAQVLPLFPDALALHQEAYKLYKEEGSKLPPNPRTIVQHDLHPYYQPVAPSAPPMHITEDEENPDYARRD